MPLTEQQKRHTRPIHQTTSKVSTLTQKRISSDLVNSSKSKNGMRSISNTTDVKKASVRPKPAVLKVKKSHSKGESSHKDSLHHPVSSPEKELGLTKLLAAASAAVAVSPGVIRRGTPGEPEVTSKGLANPPPHERSKSSIDEKQARVFKDKDINSDTKAKDEKYNTFSRAIEMLPSFNDIDDDDDDIEVPEILRDIPLKEKHLDTIMENSSTKRFTKNVKSYNPETIEKCRAIESKMLQNRRHYKKDSRFVLDLYTLTFDDDESVDSIDTRGPLFTENSIYVDEKKKDKINIDLSKIQLKENSSYVSAKNNYHDFVSLEDYLIDVAGSKSFNSQDESNHSSTDIDISLPSKSQSVSSDNENDNVRSLSGIR